MRETVVISPCQESDKRKLRKGLLVPIFVAVFVIAAYCTLCAVAATTDKIFPNVTIFEINVGGLTWEEANQKLQDEVAQQVPNAAEGVSFTAETSSGNQMLVQIPLSAVELNGEESVNRAYQVGRDCSFMKKGVLYLRCLLVGEQVFAAYGDSDQLEQLLNDVDAQLGQASVPSSYTVSDTELLLTKGQPEIKLDRQALRDEIFHVMGQGAASSLEGASSQFSVAMLEIPPETLDMTAVYDAIHTQVQNAAFDQGAKAFQMEHKGISFDVTAAQAVMEGLGWGESGTLALEITQPQTTVADLAGYLYHDLLGSCTTTIGGSANRLSNVKLAAQYFNGATLMPGEVFSYNGVVGSRTKARGFLDAPAYVSGQSVQETGGGVCQGSSTLYLAVLRANLEIVERYNHGYTVGYVPNGMDATVYYGVKDFRFQNNTVFPIKIATSVSGRTLTVNIYGTKTDDIKVEMTNETISTSSFRTVYQVDRSLPAGSTKVSVTPYSGCTVKVYRNLYSNGTLLSSALESTNIYKSRDKVISVSAADAARYGLSG